MVQELSGDPQKKLYVYIWFGKELLTIGHHVHLQGTPNQTCRDETIVVYHIRRYLDGIRQYTARVN